MTNEEKILSLKKFSIVYIKEDEIGISYPGVKNKGNRPFLYLKKLSNNRYLFVKMFTKKNNNFSNSKNLFFFKKKFRDEESVIDFNNLYIINKKELIKGIDKDINGSIKINNWFAPKSRRRELNHLFMLYLIGEQNLSSYVSFLIEQNI